jgi:hypothetical protein
MTNDLREVSSEDFRKTWADAYAKVFSGRDLDDHPFVDKKWHQFPVGAPAFYFSEPIDRLSPSEKNHCKVYDALLTAAAKVGDDEVVLFLRGGPHRNPSIFSLRGPTLSGLQELRTRPDDGFDRHIFGRSAAWGLAISWDEEVAVVGGTSVFIDAFLKRAGGPDALRDDFLEFSRYLADLSEEWRNAVSRLKSQVGW